jgi:hypothetical protein
MIALVFEARLQDLNELWNCRAVSAQTDMTDSIDVCPYSGD